MKLFPVVSACNYVYVRLLYLTTSLQIYSFDHDTTNLVCTLYVD
jgi:hypothetical protein